jgi:hypothetical protein
MALCAHCMKSNILHFYSDRIVVANALPEDLQISLCARAFTSVFSTRRTGFTNLGYEILTTTWEAVDWSIRSVEEERCHFKLRKTNLGCDILTTTGEAVDWSIGSVEEERCHFKLRKFILKRFNIFFVRSNFLFSGQSTHVY